MKEISKPKEIKIPYDDFIILLDLMDYIDISNYAEDFKVQFEHVFETLKNKKKKNRKKRSLFKLCQCKER